MKKILLVGNSHIGALKQAAEREHFAKKLVENKINLTFCGTVGAQGLKMVENFVFVERSHPQFNAFKMTSRVDSINLMEFNRVFLVGRYTPLNARLFFGINEFPHAISKGIINEICVKNIMRTFNDGVGNLFYNNMRKFTERPVCWVPNPCEPMALNICYQECAVIHPNFLDMSGYMLSFQDEIPECRDILYNTAQQVRNISEEICHSIGLNGVIFPPNQVLMSDGFRTQDSYSRGSRNFITNNEEPHVDPHMNADYGEHMLDCILEKV
jgi:hypothetical protein